MVERYLECLAARDWAGLAATLSDQRFTRVGPLGDVVEGKGAYVELVSDMIPRLPGYGFDVERVVHADPVVLVETVGRMEVDGRPTEHAEALVFDLDADGMIAGIKVYMTQPDG